MGTAEVQGELWGASAADWATVQEPAWRPVYERVLDLAGVGIGISLLDIGCGAGGALMAAQRRGAAVAGLDASPGCRRKPGSPSPTAAPSIAPSATPTLRPRCARSARPV
jgi:hypothetical protein